MAPDNTLLAQRYSIIGAELKVLRQKRKLNGETLGQLVGVSQSKIAKIENGYAPYNNALIYKILEVLSAPKLVVRRIDTLLVNQPDSRHIDFNYDISNEWIVDMESSSATVRIYNASSFIVLLQTFETRMAILKYNNVADADIPAHMAAAEKRQSLLWRSNVHYDLIMLENALYGVQTAMDLHIAQLQKLLRFLESQTIRVGFIPLRHGVPHFVTSSVAIYDSAAVAIELADRGIIFTDSPTIQRYQKELDLLEQYAVYGDDAQALVLQALQYFGAQ